MSSDLYEPLLDESKFRLTMFPIEHKDIWDMYKKQLASFWKAEEIDFSKDYDDFSKLSKDEQHFIKMTLAFFASSDNIVNFNLGERFTKEVKCQEALVCYQYQMMMENIHSECYSIMLESLIKDPIEKQELFNAVSTVPAVKLMKDWAYKWVQSDKSFAHRLIAFACVEGIFFSSSFASIFWFKLFNNKGKSIMPGLCDSNSIILRDESEHTKFACLLYSKIINRLSNDELKEIITDAVNIAQNFANESLPVRLIGMNSELMCKYLEYIADRLVVDLGYEKIYNSKNPFPYMDTIGMISKSNFFEKIELSYQSSRNDTNNKALSNLVFSDDF